MPAFTSDETLMYSVDNNVINNSPITRRDAEVSSDMLGSSKQMPKVKETMSKAEVVNVNLQMVDVPKTIQQHCNNIDLSVDVI